MTFRGSGFLPSRSHAYLNTSESAGLDPACREQVQSQGTGAGLSVENGADVGSEEPLLNGHVTACDENKQSPPAEASE